MEEIDKVAYIKIKDGQILTAKSKGNLKFYISGGKRENQESDEETLIREIKEELDITITPSSVKYFVTFKAQADGHDEGIMVKMSCYEADYEGQLKAFL